MLKAAGILVGLFLVLFPEPATTATGTAILMGVFGVSAAQGGEEE